MQTWHEFVREIQGKYKLTYREAVKRASPLWKAQASYKKKLKSNKKLAEGIEAAPEVSEFPKIDKRRKNKAKRQISAITNNNVFAPAVPAARDELKPSKKQKRDSRKHGPLLDSKFKYLSKKLYQ